MDKNEAAHLRAMFEQGSDFIAALQEPNHACEVANRAYYDLVGRTDLLGRPCQEAVLGIAAGRRRQHYSAGDIDRAPVG